MNKFIKAALVVTLGFTTLATPAQAATFTFASQPLTNLSSAGATIHGGFTNFPTKSGLYAQECQAPATAGTRPTNCIDLAWYSTSGGQGSLAPTGDISFKLLPAFTGKQSAVDCYKVSCGLFFRLDHLAPTDLSEDTFLPISFAPATAPVTALAADEITVTLNGAPLTKNVPVNLGYRADAKIVATAKSGLPVTLSSLTPDCTYANGIFTALKGTGQCALMAATEGNATYAAAKPNFPFMLVAGEQKVLGVPATLKRGAPKALPLETNFGSEITYKSATKSCVVEKNLIQAKNSGQCQVLATAPAKADMWNALSVKLVIKVK